VCTSRRNPLSLPHFAPAAPIRRWGPAASRPGPGAAVLVQGDIEMRQRLRFALPVALLLVAAPGLAEPIGSHWEVTPFGGFTIFDGKMRFPGSNLPVTDDLHVGARLAWQSRSWVGIEAATGFSSTAEDVPNGRDFDWTHASGNLVLS